MEAEEWIEAEIARQLEQLSLEDLEEEETTVENGVQVPSVPPLSQEQEDESMVSNLFQRYLQTVHSQHTSIDHLLSDTQGAIERPTGVEACKPHDVKVQGGGFDRPPLPEPSKEFEDSVPSSKGFASETAEAERIILSSQSVSFSQQIELNAQVQERIGGELEEEDSVEDDVLASDGGHAELQAALVRLKEEERKREEGLLREQREREATLTAMIEEGKRLKHEQEKIMAERADRERIRRSNAATTLQACWRGNAARRLYLPQLETLRQRRLQEQQKEKELELKRREGEAARVIQLHWRGYRYRKEMASDLHRRREDRQCQSEEANAQAGTTELSVHTTEAESVDTSVHNASLVMTASEPTAVSVTGTNNTGKSGAHASDSSTISNAHTISNTGTSIADTGASTDTGAADIASHPVVSSPGKFTVSRRIQTALRLRENASPLDGEPLQCTEASVSDAAITQSASLEETIQCQKSLLQESANLVKTSESMVGLSGVDRQMVANEVQRIQVEEEKGKIDKEGGNDLEPNAAGTVVPLLSQITSSVVDSVVTSREDLKDSSSVGDDREIEKSDRTADEGAVSSAHHGESHSTHHSPIPDGELATQSCPERNLSQTNSPGEDFTRQTEPHSDTRIQIEVEGRLRVSENVLGSQQKDSTLEEHKVIKISPKGSLKDGGGVEEDLLVREQRALDALVESREREELVAQMSRERMSRMVSAEELAQVAKTKRSHSSYVQELEHACSPLSAQAWLGVVEERQEQWRRNHMPWREPECDWRSIGQSSSPPLKPKSVPQPLPLSDVQLVAASLPGTKLNQVTQVIAYRSRAPVDLRCLSRCPRLLSLSLTKCGVTFLSGMSGSGQIREISMQCNGMEHVDCSGLSELCFMDLGDNRLASIHGLEDCRSLLELNLAENRIARIGGLSGCPRLQKLVVDGNLVISSKGLENTPLLQLFSCSENHLPRLEGIQHVQLLQHIHLSQNNLQEVPALPSHVLLRELRLDENSLSSVAPVARAWLPLLQTLTLANNCITQLDSLVCLLMLRTLDLSNNSLFDLPGVLQCLRGCYELRHLCCRGNPITEEPKYRSYLLKSLPHLEELDDQEARRTKRAVLPEAVVSSGLYQLCKRQGVEQDKMGTRQQQEIDALLDASTPEAVEQLLNRKVSHCAEFQELLVRHLREHETFVAERSRHTTKTSSSSKQRSSAQPTPTIVTTSTTSTANTPPCTHLSQAATVVQAAWRGWYVRQWVRRCSLAAARIQAVWRGYITRRLLHPGLTALLRRRHWAATIIQAHYRGFCLRRRLRAVLERAHHIGDEEAGEREEEFDYEEEIKLDCLDESLLENDLHPLSPRYPVLQHSETPSLTSHTTPTPHPVITVPTYAPPGMAESEISFNLWKQQNHHGQTTERKRPPMFTDSPTQANEVNSHSQTAALDRPTIVPYVSEETGAPLISMRPGDIPPHPLPKAQPAWGSSTQLPEAEVKDSSQLVTSSAGARVEGSRMEEVQTGRISPVVGGRGLVNIAKREQIASEWGFKSSATADLMLKRAQRQKRLQATATMRKKLAEAQGFGYGPTVGPRAQRQLHRVEYFQACSVKSSPSPDPEETGAKDEFLYRWVHSQRVVHSEGGGGGGGGGGRTTEVEIPSGASKYHPMKSKLRYPPASSDCSLPQMEPHVLAGHIARLVSSDAQNLLVEALDPEQPRDTTHSKQLKARSMHDYHHAQQQTQISSSSFPSMHTSTVQDNPQIFRP